MRKLVVTVVVLAAALAVGDMLVRNVAEDQVAQVTETNVPGGGEATASIHSFPFVVRLAMNGEVTRVVVRQDGVAAGPLSFRQVTVDVHGVRVDRDRLVDEQELAILDIEQGTVTAELTQQAVTEATGVPVTFTEGRASARILGRTVNATAVINGGVLVLRPTGLGPVRVPIPDAPLIPCVSDVEIHDGFVALRCRVTEVPPELLREANVRLPQPPR